MDPRGREAPVLCVRRTLYIFIVKSCYEPGFQSLYMLNLSVNVDKPATLISRKIDMIINHTSFYEMLPER
jgi:hypothetical protein